MVVENEWFGLDRRVWSDLDRVRAILAAGADPDSSVRYIGKPLHHAAAFGAADVVAELAARVDDVDDQSDGRTALWRAVYATRPDNARALAAAGADPWRPMMAGWSPGRLSLAGPTPDLFGPAAESLSAAEVAAAEQARHLTAVLDGLWTEGLGLACVAGIDVTEAARRLAADVISDTETLEQQVGSDPLAEENLRVVWATDVPGGCVIAQPWAFAPSIPGVTKLLSAATTCYAMYANPKSGDQGSISRDGETVGWDLHPAGGADEHDPPDEILAFYLYQRNAVAYCCAHVNLRPTDARAFIGPPDSWLRLPNRDYWH